MRRAGDFVVGTDRVADAERPAEVEGVTLTRTEPLLRSAPVSSHVRPDASFIAHLIATAEQVPQTRTLRRAEIADVEAAYRATVTNFAGSSTGRTRVTA
jgi:hypothetical protein